MNNETRILGLLEQKGYITVEEVEREGISRRFLSLMVNKNKINRLSRGLYALPDELDDEFFIIDFKSKNSVFSNMTALYFHGLCDRIPLKYDVTVRNEYKGSLQKDDKVNLFYVKRENIDLGLINMITNYGNSVRVYDVERSICDIIKNKRRFDLELYNKAVRDYYYSKTKETNRLYDYADILGIYKKVKKTFEVLT